MKKAQSRAISFKKIRNAKMCKTTFETRYMIKMSGLVVRWSKIFDFYVRCQNQIVAI